MKTNLSANNESTPNTNQEQSNLSPETPKDLGTAIPSAAGNEGALKTAGSPPESAPQTVAPSSANERPSKRKVELQAAIPAGVPAKKGTVRLEGDFSADLNRMENAIFLRTNLEASPKRMLQKIIAEADMIFDDLFHSYHFLPPADPKGLKRRLDATHEKLAELRTIETRGKVITKFTLTAKEMSKLCTYAQAFNSYFAAEYTPRNVLKLLWKRGGVLIAENLSKPQA